jgi:hypothetical protein
MRSLFLVVMLAHFTAVCPVTAQAFPVPRGEAEFRVLVRAHIQEARGLSGNVSGFITLALPYGPLDLQVRKSTSPKEAETLRSFYLGVIGAAANVDPARLASDFHCGPPCAAQRKDFMRKQLPTIRRLVNEFRKSSLSVVAQWAPSEFRVNDLFVRGGQVREAVASPNLGFVPSGVWRTRDRAAALKSLQTSEAVIGRILSDMRMADIAAIVRNKDVVRVAWAGIGDNEAGLLFTVNPPTRGQVRPDGAAYSVVELVAPGVFFYTTS